MKRVTYSLPLVLFGFLLPFAGLADLLVRECYLLTFIMFLFFALRRQGFHGRLFLSLLLVHVVFLLFEFLYSHDAFSLKNVVYAIFPVKSITALHYAVYEVLLYILLFFGISSFMHQEDKTKPFILACMAGMCCATVVFALHLFGMFHFQFFEEAPFWEAIERVSATFTDPNAYGIFVALLIPYFYYAIREIKGLSFRLLLFLASVAIVYVAVYSGSRTMFIGLAVSLLYLLVTGMPERIRLRVWLGCFFFVFFTVALINFTPRHFCALFPKGLQRTCTAVQVKNLYQSFYSRSVFTKLNVAMIAEQPIAGVGFQRFEKELPKYKARTGVAIGEWIDNPNSFYLGLISELGIGGLFLFLISVMDFRLKAGNTSYIRSANASSLSLFVMLFTGPHINFLQVAVLSTISLGISLRGVAPKRGFSSVLVPCLMLLFVTVFTYRSFLRWEYGFYPKETGVDGDFYWTRLRAKKEFNCVDGSLALSYRSIHPGIHEKPLVIRFVYNGIEEGRVLRTHDLQEITLPCDTPHLVLGVEVSRTWVPRDYNMGKDSRRLGIQIYEYSQ